jgi:hypothetical protein
MVKMEMAPLTKANYKAKTKVKWWSTLYLCYGHAKVQMQRGVVYLC